MTALALAALIAQTVEWTANGGDAGGTRHSKASQINSKNVSTLQVAWTLKTSGLVRPKNQRPSALETTPLYVNGTLYLTSAIGRVIAADPATGKELWSFDPKIDTNAGWGDFTNRGVSYHRSGLVILASLDARLFALDAKSGAKRWEIDLRKGLRIAPQELSEYEETSPPCVIGDVIVVGSAVADNGRIDMPSGEVRGFDVKTGKLLWTWDPAPGSRVGGANAWSVITADESRGLVFVPTGSASPDYYGGARKEPNDANSVVALHAKTGKVKWKFQTVHHDIWDYDVASPPALVKAAGKDAVAVGSKTGHLFILDRDSGKPIFGVEERPVPKSDAQGEEASPTQPFPVKPPSLSPHTAEIRPACKDMVVGLRNEGPFTPPSPGGTLVVPGNIGGLHWGGVAYDPALGLIVVPSNNLAALVRLIKRDDLSSERKGDKFGMEFANQSGTPYGMARRFLIGPDGAPCSAPPWGILSAVDTATGEIKWKVPLGTSPGSEKGTGFPNLGGLITTASGLTFIGATLDGFFRAFDTKTGAELWATKLPASARATPMTYVHKGKQYVVIAAGGHDEKFGPLGDEVVAFALPD